MTQVPSTIQVVTPNYIDTTYVKSILQVSEFIF